MKVGLELEVVAGYFGRVVEQRILEAIGEGVSPQVDLQLEGSNSEAAKEVTLYRDALKLGYQHLHKSDGLITNRTLIEMFRLLKRNDGGFRATPGTALKKIPPVNLSTSRLRTSARSKQQCRHWNVSSTRMNILRSIL